MKNLSLLLLCLMAYSFANACGNDYYITTKADGSSSQIGTYDLNLRTYNLTRRFDIVWLLESKQEKEAQLQKDPHNYMLLSDYALVLMKIGKIQESLSILRDLYRSHPKEYNILANLGTVYELAGKPDSALLMLKKAVEINPASHNGSEWIHLKILEKKIEVKKKGGDFHYSSIVGLEIADLADYYDQFNKQPQAYQDSINRIKEQIQWQLEERTLFVEPGDLYVAFLLYDLARLVAVTESVEASLPVFELALVYAPGQNEIRNTYKELLPLAKELVAHEENESLGLRGLILITYLTITAPVVIFFVILAIQKKRNKSESGAQG